MSLNPREKFLKVLRKQMKNGETATERTNATKLYAQLMGENGGLGIDADGNTVENGTVLRPMTESSHPVEPTEYDETARAAGLAHPDDGLGCLLHLLKPKLWMDGAWDESVNGWTNGKDADRLLSWDEARVLIADRIAELNLDPDKVYSYPRQCGTSIHEHMAFLRADFAVQMESFK